MAYYTEINDSQGELGFLLLKWSLHWFVSIGLKLRCCQPLVTKKIQLNKDIYYLHDMKSRVRATAGIG